MSELLTRDHDGELAALRGISPDILPGEFSEDFVARIRRGWGGGDDGELAAYREALAAGEWDVWGICAACGGEEPTGHRDNCATQIALSGERGPKLAAIIEAAQRVRDWSVRMPDEPVPGVVYDLIAAVVASEEDR